MVAMVSWVIAMICLLIFVLRVVGAQAQMSQACGATLMPPTPRVKRRRGRLPSEAKLCGRALQWQDSLAERSKAVAQGAIPQGRGFEPHSCHFTPFSICDCLFCLFQRFAPRIAVP